MRVFIFVLIWILQVWAKREKGQELCYTTDDLLGACVVLSSCPTIEAITINNNSRESQTFIKDLQERCDSRTFLDEPIVCCKEAYRGSRRGKGKKKGHQNSQNVTIDETSTLPIIFERIGDDEEPCRSPSGEQGTCRDLVQCETLMGQLQLRQNDPTFAQFLRQSNQACRVSPPTVCCPSDTSQLSLAGRLPTREEGCGVFTASDDKIVGGSESDIGAWPWITLLGYEDVFGGVTFRCGGVLITARHVLTAAHCTRRDLRFVRLGEHDLTTDSETLHVDIGISKVESHPQYSRNDGHSDIAIIYLERNAPLSSLIKPICLPRRGALYVGTNSFVAGWGKTMEDGQTSNVLQEIRIPVHQNSVCRNSYAQLNRSISAKQFDSAVICAGALEGGVDTCQGDSGGPLMAPEVYNGKHIFTAIGLVSYSIGCARPNSPGVYASIPYFMDWIETKVADRST